VAAAEATATPPAAAVDVDPRGLRDQSLAGVRPGMLRRLKRALQDVQNGVLDQLRQADGVDPDALMPTGDDLEQLTGVAQMFLTAAYRAGVHDGGALVGQEAPEDAGDAGRVPDDAAAFRDLLANEIRASLTPSLRAGIEAGEPEPSLSERVGEVFRDLKGPVIETVVDEHLTRVYGHGLIGVWRELDVDQKSWVLGDEPRCPENQCRGNDAEGAVALEADFSSGDLVPPAHPGCTCAIRAS
jgi:hypothetical protein